MVLVIPLFLKRMAGFGGSVRLCRVRDKHDAGPDWGGAVVEGFAGAVGSGEGQGEQAHELGEALGVGEVGVLEVEAPGFQGDEQEVPVIDGAGRR